VLFRRQAEDTVAILHTNMCSIAFHFVVRSFRILLRGCSYLASNAYYLSISRERAPWVMGWEEAKMALCELESAGGD
jgi:hypothetical protein